MERRANIFSAFWPRSEIEFRLGDWERVRWGNYTPTAWTLVPRLDSAAAIAGAAEPSPDSWDGVVYVCAEARQRGRDRTLRIGTEVARPRLLGRPVYSKICMVWNNNNNNNNKTIFKSRNMAWTKGKGSVQMFIESLIQPMKNMKVQTNMSWDVAWMYLQLQHFSQFREVGSSRLAQWRKTLERQTQWLQVWSDRPTQHGSTRHARHGFQKIRYILWRYINELYVSRQILNWRAAMEPVRLSRKMEWCGLTPIQKTCSRIQHQLSEYVHR